VRLLLRILLGALLALPLAATAQDEPKERILNFLSAVTIEPDGNLDVTETIRIVALNEEIKHGIQRDFPTRYRTNFAQRTAKGFEVISVQRDGLDEPWERMSLSNGVRIRIGAADKMVPTGEHTYAIRYRTTRQLIYGKDSDELYWNVTGNGWTFPIDHAEARITLPRPAAFGSRAFYTGPQGSTAKNATVIDERPGYIAFQTTAPLGREEGLTVAAAFPKGVVAAPSAGQSLLWWLAGWGALAAAVAACVGLVVYYIRAWALVGRGPRAGPVVPIFSPPDGLTPAAIRYVSKMKFDNRVFTAAIVDLGVRGQVHITKEDGGWLAKDTTTLTRTDRGRSFDKTLPAPEISMRQALFVGGDSLRLKQENHTTLQAARTALEKGLKEAYSGKLFVDNRGWAVLGLISIPALMLAVAILAILFEPGSTPTEQIMLPVAAVALLGGCWWLYGIAQQAKAGGKGGVKILAWIAFAVLGVSTLVFAFSTIVAAMAGGALAILLPAVLLPLAISASWWMYAPTLEGRAVMDRIAGFRQYLGITEEHRLDTMHPPEKTPELFERYLPYAIALEVENRWAESFATVLAAAAAAGAAHTAAWYTGSGNMWDDPEGFASTVGSSLDSTVSSAATSPSSSGSSGGGSSGGGGGGGGGSGW
jgi:uncharacterized membrane protein YgcG